jgi:ElaB/YqjD/DUF883 family membrane-anchored ribosome-binding protein
MQETEQHIAKISLTSDDLLEQLRQISDALWDAVGNKATGKIDELLAQREEALNSVALLKPLTEAQRRTLMAIQSADKYLMRQLENELNLLDHRLSGVVRRKGAAAGYRRETPAKSYVTRTG